MDDVKTTKPASSNTKIVEDKKEDADNTNGSGDEPLKKIAKLANKQQIVNLEFNVNYQQKELIKWLSTAWKAGRQAKDAIDAASGIQVYTDPFQIGLLPELLQSNDACKALVDEMVNKVQWHHKQMDLYEFHQSTDLSSMTECPLLTDFLQLLRRQVRPWLEQLTGLKLDYVSASCSMYNCGDYLLVHDDLLKDRQIAFIYYLSPWEGATNWTEAQGGCLEIFNSDEHYFPQFPVRRKISPKNNQFAFFKVGARSFHQVGEVTNYDYPRLTINGWFHGATNKEGVTYSLQPFTRLNFKQPDIEAKPNLELYLNEIYLKAASRRRIQYRVEENSEICLYEFLKREVFEKALAQLLHDDKLVWRRQGPANAQNYEVLEASSASETINQLLTLFASNEMFKLLRDYTDLDLFGADAITPTCSVELQRWTHGDYTILGEHALCEESTLDLLYYLNATEGCAVITYLSDDIGVFDSMKYKKINDPNDSEEQDEDSVLLTIAPVDNALNIAYRCDATFKFTKYVSRNTPLDKGPIFAIACSYKE